MSSNQIDYKAVGKQVEEEVLKQKRAVRVVFFVVSLLMVLIFGIVGWGMYSTVLDTISSDVAGILGGALTMMMMGGVLGAMFQGIALALDTKSGEAQMRERATARALSSELMRLSQEAAEEADKPKREMRLSDDGELMDVDAPIEETQDVTLTLEDVKRRRQ
jgi:hypothetical protein